MFQKHNIELESFKSYYGYEHISIATSKNTDYVHRPYSCRRRNIWAFVNVYIIVVVETYETLLVRPL